MDAASPLVDTVLAEQLYVVTEQGEAAEIRAMFDECVNDAIGRLGGLRVIASSLAEDAAAIRELHQLRGSIGNFGLRRASERMRALESNWGKLPVVAREAELDAAAAEVHAAVAALRQRYVFLGL